jgi:16S rRNA (uracil1498-N3)-methyltransferase
LFYCTDSFTTGSVIHIGSGEFHHLKNVKRLQAKSGTAIQLCNGKGEFADGTLTSVDRTGARVTITDVYPQPAPKHSIIIAPAILKKSAFEGVVEKAVELGVQQFCPLLADHCIARDDKNARWQTLAIAALKQSKNPWMMNIAAPQSLTSLLTAYPKVQWYVCHEEGVTGFKNLSRTAQPNTTGLLIGPEGGWSANEMAIFAKHQLAAVKLHRHRLRAETAVVVAISQLLFALDSVNLSR